MITLGSIVMLCVMTFNVGILFIVVFGQTIGYIIVPKAEPVESGIAE